MTPPPARVWLSRYDEPLDPALATSSRIPAPCRRSPRVGAVSRRPSSASSIRSRFSPLARAQEPRRIDGGEEDRVAHQPVRLRVGAGRDGGRVHPRHRRIHGVVSGEDDAARAERMQVRHQFRRDVVRPQPVEDDQQMPLLRAPGRPPLGLRRGRPASGGEARKGRPAARPRGIRAWGRSIATRRARLRTPAPPATASTGRRHGIAPCTSAAGSRSAVGHFRARHDGSPALHWWAWRWHDT